MLKLAKSRTSFQILRSNGGVNERGGAVRTVQNRVDKTIIIII